MTGQRLLIWASVAFVAANLLHTLDHLRQGIGGLTTEVLAGGTVITVAAIATLYLAVRDDPRAPLAAAVVGLWTAFGVAASHIAPHWSAFSDPYPDIQVDALSWAVMLAEIGAAVGLGLVGIRELRRQAAPGSWLSSST
jgi:hypothetical protein